MASKRSKRGREIDMAALLSQKGDTLAVGNLGMNARGDMLDSNGNVVKTAKELAEEYYKSNPKAVKHVSIKDQVAEDAKKASEPQPSKRTTRSKKAEETPKTEDKAPDTLED